MDPTQDPGLGVRYQALCIASAFFTGRTRSKLSVEALRGKMRDMPLSLSYFDAMLEAPAGECTAIVEKHADAAVASRLGWLTIAQHREAAHQRLMAELADDEQGNGDGSLAPSPGL
jgi:hypothetical protein